MNKKLAGFLAAMLLAFACALPTAAFAAEADLVFGTQASSTWTRLGGEDAIATMSEIVDVTYPERNSCSTVILATNDGYWDALTASGLAGLYDGPVLLTNPNILSDLTKYQIARLNPKQVIIAGGSMAISPVIEAQIKEAYPDMKVARAKGDDAVGTALDIYNKGKSVNGGWGKVALIATNGGYWDALSASPYSFAKQAPIFLASEGSGAKSLRSDTLSAIKAGGFTKVYICGGTLAISSNVEKQLSGIKVERLAGSDAIATSQKIATQCVTDGMQPNGMCVATSEGYWDGLSGAALAGSNNAPLILAKPGSPSTATSGFVSSHKGEISQGYVLGGTMVVPKATLTALENTTK
ncbi:MAG: cell wall-binding repeat-containing protein [Eggerthellaceae bacterium]|nr:cell wall-binding repeat-containing protein [Eggerthellaceae bacterium]